LYIGPYIAGCKVFFRADRAESPNCSVSRLTAASVAAADLTTSRCYAHRARRLTLMKPMCIDSRHVCAEATLIYSSPCQVVTLFYPHPPTEKNISPVLHELHKWSLGVRGSSCSICSIMATPLVNSVIMQEVN